MRGQIYFRDQANTADGSAVVAGVGILEVPQGCFAENLVRGVILTGGKDNFSLSLTNYFNDLSDHDATRAAEIDAAARLPVWPLPSSLAGEVFGGGLMARRTRMPATAGCEILMCIAVIKAPADRIARGTMYEIEGAIETPDDVSDPQHMPFHVRFDCVRPRPAPELSMPGQNLAQLLKLPVWGFHAEGMAFNSTMSLSLIDLCDECIELNDLDDPTSEQRARLDVLRASEAGFVLDAAERDVEFAEFRKAMIETCGRNPFDGVRTASEISARSAASRAILAGMLSAPAPGSF